jgi:hypothetical protein
VAKSDELQNLGPETQKIGLARAALDASGSVKIGVFDKNRSMADGCKQFAGID